MENSNEQDTLPNLETVLNAINNLQNEISGLRSEMNERLDKVETRLTSVETDIDEIKQLQFVFENQFDRLLASTYKSLELSHENRADLKIIRKEVESWLHEIKDLERRSLRKFQKRKNSLQFKLKRIFSFPDYCFAV